MRRVRDNEKFSFIDHETREDFLSEPRPSGVHSIRHNGQRLDLLIENRNSSATVVSFHGAIPTNVPTYPRFDGGGITKRASVNLIAVADPSIAMGIDLGWHLGNQIIGPLRPVLSPLIDHVLESLGTERTILLGGSGGGFAAAHFAHDFPGSIAFIFNPRLSLDRLPRRSIRSYLATCHDFEGTLMVPTDNERKRLLPFGPTDIADISIDSLNHYLLIYQNLLDEDFMRTQFLPFIADVQHNPGIQVNLSLDGPGHVYIPRNNVDEILSELTNQKPLNEAIRSAGFKGPFESYSQVLHDIAEMRIETA